MSRRRLEALLGWRWNDLVRFAGHAARYYESYDQRRVGTTKWRHIDLPSPKLRELQKRVDRRILRTVTLPETMLGAVTGRSIRENAAFHQGQRIVITIDLKACFPTIRDTAVFLALRRELLCSEEIAGVLTKLTTYHHRIPQGAPTSSRLANLVLRPLHDAIQDLVLARGLRCTFWIDDITLSGASAADCLEDVIRLIHRHDHAVSRKKVHLMPAGGRQTVTGVVVNRKVSAGRGYCCRVRAAIRDALLSEAVTSDELNRIRGRVCYVTFLCPKQGASLERLLAKVTDVAVLPRLPREARRPLEFRPCKRRHRDRDEDRPTRSPKHRSE